jgi:hypothetical protein
VTIAPICFLPYFQKVFEVQCDVSNNSIGVVLNQYSKPIALCSEKFNDL